MDLSLTTKKKLCFQTQEYLYVVTNFCTFLNINWDKCISKIPIAFCVCMNLCQNRICLNSCTLNTEHITHLGSYWKHEHKNVELHYKDLDSAVGYQGSVFPFSHQFLFDMSTWITNNIRCCRRWICRMIHLLRFWVQSIGKLYLLIKGLAYDPSQGPETIQTYFQTGGETYEHGWISWGEA